MGDTPLTVMTTRAPAVLKTWGLLGSLSQSLGVLISFRDSANVKCLLERLAGEGQEAQAGRRREEEQAKMERKVHWLERITGRNLSRRGDFRQL